MSDIQGAAESQNSPAGGSDVEARARNMGWRPLEEFKGDQATWKDAGEFVRTAEANLPVMNERYRALEGRYFKDTTDLRQELEGVNKRLGETQQVLTEFRDFNSRTEQRAYERAKRELESKRDVAVAHADTESFKETQRELDELEKSVRAAPAATQTEARPAQQDPPKPATPPPPDPAILQWITDNPWYNTDLDLRNEAHVFDAGIMSTQPGLSTAARLALVREKVHRSYPERFENQRRNGAVAAVAEPDSAASPRRNPRQKTFADLPPDAQGACDRIIRTMADAAKGKNVKAYTREDYVREYFMGEE